MEYHQFFHLEWRLWRWSLARWLMFKAACIGRTPSSPSKDSPPNPRYACRASERTKRSCLQLPINYISILCAIRICESFNSVISSWCSKYYRVSLFYVFMNLHFHQSTISYSITQYNYKLADMDICLQWSFIQCIYPGSW